MITLEPNARVHIRGEDYSPATDAEPLKNGDIVYDQGDGCWGKIEQIVEREGKTYAAVGDEIAVEVGIPVERLVKLTKIS